MVLSCSTFSRAHGAIKYNYVSRDNNKKFWYKRPEGRKGGQLLPDHLKERFLDEQVFVVAYDEPSDEAEREVFQVRHFILY